MHEAAVTSPQSRLSMLKRSENYLLDFESNLEYIIDMMSYGKKLKVEYDKFLPSISAAMAVMNFESFFAGRDNKELNDYVSKYVKNTIFRESLLEGFWANQFIQGVKTFVGRAVLGFNPVSFFKEAIAGLWIHYSRSIGTNVSEFVTGESMGRLRYSYMHKGYTTITADAFNRVGTTSLLEAINREYGIVNLQPEDFVNAQNQQIYDAGRFEYFMFGSNKAPDWLNKMVFMVGYMHQHGVYNAYSMDKFNNLVYEWKKDKRFSLLASKNKSNKSQYLH